MIITKKSGITIHNLSYSYHTKKESKLILDNINLNIYKGEFITIFGPNGSGKTTLLNILAGFINQNKGTIKFHNKKNLRISYIFQNYRESIFPWMTAFDNIAYPLKVKKITKTEIKKRVLEIYKKFNMKFDLQTYPYLLSGGQQQMIAIMRGFIDKPDLMLMDEPFSALDYQTTIHLEQKLQEFWSKSKTTIIFISHDIREAILLADRIVVFGKSKPTTIARIIIDNLSRPRKPRIMTTRKFINMEKQILTLLELNT